MSTRLSWQWVTTNSSSCVCWRSRRCTADDVYSPICASQLRQVEAVRGCVSPAAAMVTRSTSTYFGARSFAVACPTAWNQLPADVRSTESVNSFKTVLKTFLFRLSADWSPDTRAPVMTFSCYGGLEIVCAITIIINTYKTAHAHVQQWDSEKVISAGLSSANSTLMEIQTTAASLTDQQTQLNAKLENMSAIASTFIDGCMTDNCNDLRSTLSNLNTGPAYSVSCKFIEFLGVGLFCSV